MIRRIMLSSIAFFALAGIVGCETGRDDQSTPPNYDLDKPEKPELEPRPKTGLRPVG